MSSNIQHEHIRNIKKLEQNQTTNMENEHFASLPLDSTNEYLTTLNFQQKSSNMACCTGDQKKLIKNQIKAPQITKQSVEIKDVHDEEIESDHLKIKQELQKQESSDDLDDDIRDLTKAVIDRLAYRKSIAHMNSNNDHPPRLCTKKHCTFANEPLTIKPVTCIPGIGSKHGNLCEKHGLIMAHQLLSIYMTSFNDEEFENFLIKQVGFTSKSAMMTRDGLKEMRRHLI